MKIRSLLIASLAIVLPACTALALGSLETVTGNGVVRLESRDVKAFTGVEIAGPGLVRFSPGAVRQLTVEADANLLPYLETEVRGGILVLRVRPGVQVRPTRLVYRVTAPELRSIDIAGSGDFRLEAPLEADRVEIRIAGSGDVEGGFAVEGIAVAIRGSGDVRLSGTAETVRFDIGGSGDIEAADLAAADARVVIRGSGSVTLQASRTLDVDIGGSGDVRFRGEAKVTVRDAGSGEISEY